MKCAPWIRTWLGLICLGAWAGRVAAQTENFRSPAIIPLVTPQLWQKLEFAITNIPAAQNPFDPDLIRLDATFVLPSGRQMVVPAFWNQDYQRALVGGSEHDTPSGTAGWRLRFTPPEAGTYALSLAIQTNGQTLGAPTMTHFAVASSAVPARYGYVQLSQSRQYFATGDGSALPLIGADVCWPSSRGTYDYDTWFASMHVAGENFARIWMWPSSFGIEDAPATLNNYALEPAWQLDYVLQLAEQKGIYLQLTLDYHGMFVTQPDYWGGNNWWPQNPYNATNNGPCENPNSFFTNATAQTIYQKRLRYLIGRYGYSQNILAWEFLNEIDNDYSFLKPAAVASWHGVMGNWMGSNDCFGHLLTTSLSSAKSHPELWSLPQLSYSSEHSYLMTASPFSIASDAQYFLKMFRKPIMMGEFGTSWKGWNETGDPYLRGFREGIWTGALGGSVGTSMSWWWQNIDSENQYHVYAALSSVLQRTGWATGSWTNLTAQPSPNFSGQRGPHESLIYLAAANATFPTGATNASLRLQHGTSVTLNEWPAGQHYAEWYDPATGLALGTSQGNSRNSRLTLALPDFTVDLAGIIYPAPILTPLGVNNGGAMQIQLFSETGGKYVFQESPDLLNWSAVLTVTNVTGTTNLAVPIPLRGPAQFFRAAKN